MRAAVSLAVRSADATVGAAASSSFRTDPKRGRSSSSNGCTLEIGGWCCIASACPCSMLRFVRGDADEFTFFSTARATSDAFWWSATSG